MAVMITTGERTEGAGADTEIADVQPAVVANVAETALYALRFLNDANRVRLLMMLAQHEACVSDLTARLDLPQSLVSYHLRRLREARVVRTERRAQRIYYTIDPAAWASFTAPIRELCNIATVVADEAGTTGEASSAVTSGAADRAA